VTPQVAGEAAESRDAVVSLCVGETASRCNLRCTGVLLTPNLVLTAHHCALVSDDGGADCLTGRVVGPLLAPNTVWVSSASTLDPARAASPGRGWTVPRATGRCGNDLALLSLVSPLAGGTSAIALEAQRGQVAAAIGFGGTATQPGGIRREALSSLICIGNNDGCSALNQSSTIQARELAAGATVCQGDSGGPALLAAGTAGILSRAIAADGRCGTAVYSNVRAHALWLARNTRSATATSAAALPVPLWVPDAEQLGNGGGVAPRAFGAPCDEDLDCNSRHCRSGDNLASFVCSMPCAAGCPEGSQCRKTDDGDACFMEAAQQGCASCRIPGLPARGGADDTWGTWVPLLLLLVAQRRMARR
jgi:hypothetical protein